MADKSESGQDHDDLRNPLMAGLGALIGVAVVVGILAGVVVLVGSRVIGVGGGSSSGAEVDAEAGASLEMPSLVPTSDATDALVTLNPTGQTSESSSADSTESTTEKPKKKKRKISLTGSPNPVSGENLVLSGTYKTGEGQELTIERKVGDGDWSEFTYVQADVSGGLYRSEVFTSQVGEIKWRMWDKDRDIRSNVVTIEHTG